MKTFSGFSIAFNIDDTNSWFEDICGAYIVVAAAADVLRISALLVSVADDEYSNT